MDIVLLVKFLAPCLPFLVNVGNKAVEGASQKIGEDVWQKAKAIWGKLDSSVESKEAAKEAAVDLAKNPDDEDLQASLRVQLKKILETDTALATEITKIWQTASPIQPDGENVQINANAYDQSVVKQVGKIVADQVSF